MSFCLLLLSNRMFPSFQFYHILECQSVFTAQRGRSFRSCLLCTHHYYTTLHINCGLASVFTSSDPFRNCPPPSPPHCREHQSLTTSNNSPTHFALQAALRPCGGGLGGRSVNPCDTDSAFFLPYLLLSSSSWTAAGWKTWGVIGA